MKSSSKCFRCCLTQILKCYFTDWRRTPDSQKSVKILCNTFVRSITKCPQRRRTTHLHQSTTITPSSPTPLDQAIRHRTHHPITPAIHPTPTTILRNHPIIKLHLFLTSMLLHTLRTCTAKLIHTQRRSTFLPIPATHPTTTPLRIQALLCPAVLPPLLSQQSSTQKSHFTEAPPWVLAYIMSRPSIPSTKPQNPASQLDPRGNQRPLSLFSSQHPPQLSPLFQDLVEGGGKHWVTPCKITHFQVTPFQVTQHHLDSRHSAFHRTISSTS